MNHHVNGHTLIELLIVVAILGSVIIVTPPIFSWMNMAGVHQAAEHLYAELQLARISAIRNKQPCALTFNIPGPDNYCNAVTHKCVDLDQYRGGVRFLNTGPDGRSMAEKIRFNRQGMSMSIAPVQVYLTNKEGSAIYRIRVMLPGGLTLDRWNGKSW